MATMTQPAGTVTLVFTDIEGSTQILARLGQAAYRDALAEHRSAVREAFGRHGGYEVDNQGDSFFFSFPTASGAVNAVREATAALDGGPIAVRVGIHTGEPDLDPPKYVGIDVHTAARIMAAGHGGQIVISQSTRDLLDDSFALSDLGEHRLKDLSGPRRLYPLGVTRFPPLKTLHRTNLPVPATAFLGRDRELDELGALLADGVRLLTLTGPGGTARHALRCRQLPLLRTNFQTASGGSRSRRCAIPSSYCRRSRSRSAFPSRPAAGSKRRSPTCSPPAAQSSCSTISSTSYPTQRRRSRPFAIPAGPRSSSRAESGFASQANTSIRSSCSWPARSRSETTRVRPQPSKSSARASTTCRSQSSSPPRAQACLHPRRCCRASAGASTGCAGIGTPIRASRPFEPRSPGRTTCSTSPNRTCSPGSRSSPGGRHSTRSRRSAKATWTSSSRCSTGASSGGRAGAYGCWRRSASSPRRSSTATRTPRRCERRTPATTSDSPRPPTGS